MIRPATILSVSLFAAFALILIAVLSTPVVKGIPLGSFDDVTFGVFGFCEGSRCSGIEIGYDPSGILNASESSFDLPSSVRNSLTTILIIHPVAAFLMLVQFIMAVVSHLHSPGHSTLYLLIFFIVSVIGFLVCLLAFIVDVLLFVPHLAWGSYLVVAATVLAGLSSVFICAMRRTLISRKHRKKRIAENAEMSGENYYNREAQKAVTLARQPTMPSVSSGANGGADALPTFATFGDQNDEKPAEERIPLTRPSPSDQSAHLARANTVSPVNGLPYAEAMNQNPQDQFGNPMGPSAAEYAALRRGPPVDQFHARGGRGGMPPPGNRGGRGGYGRGGYGPPPGRGAYGGPGRGGYGPPGRGGYGNPRGGYGPPRGGPGGMRGGGQPPYQGGGPYRGVGPYQGGGQAPYQGGGQPPYQNYQNGAGSYDRRPSPSNAYAGAYGRGPNDPYNNTANAPANGYGTYGSDVSSLPRAESPPALSNVSSHPQSVAEMDATPAAGSTTQIGTIRDSDTDVAGMVALQQPRGDGQAANVQASDASTYSNEDPQGQYVPPRANWNQGQGQGRQSPAVPSPLATGQPTQTQGRSSPDNGAVSYYEDVDPRYAAEPDNRNLAQPRYDNGFQDPSPQWAGNYGGRPTPQNSNPDFQNRTGAPGGSPPPGAPGRQYHGF